MESMGRIVIGTKKIWQFLKNTIINYRKQASGKKTHTITVHSTLTCDYYLHGHKVKNEYLISHKK